MTDRLLFAALAALLGLSAAALAQPAARVVVAQRDRDFAVAELGVAAGTRLAFSNDDPFPHQISAAGPGVAMSSALQRPGETLEVLLPQQGLVQIRCGIHPRMRLAVRVQ